MTFCQKSVVCRMVLPTAGREIVANNLKLSPQFSGGWHGEAQGNLVRLGSGDEGPAGSCSALRSDRCCAPNAVI